MTQPPADMVQMELAALMNGAVHDIHVTSAGPSASPPAAYLPGQSELPAQAVGLNGTAALAGQPSQAADQQPGEQQGSDAQSAAAPRRRRATKRRLPTQRIFSDLAAQAAISPNAYAIGEDVDGAMCLIRTNEGFEVFNSAAGARHEVRIFQDEESAYFYLFGVLVAEAVRTGALAPRQ